MIIHKLIVCTAVFVFTGGAYAVPFVQPDMENVVVSAYAHTIQHGTDAHSFILEADTGITPNLGLTAELTRIGDDCGRSYLGNVYVRRPLALGGSPKCAAAGFVGLTWLDVKDEYGSESDSLGISVGMLGDYVINPEASLYGRVGLVFLDEPLWTFDLGVRYRFTPRWFFDLGYRAYDADGSFFGGFTAGTTYKLSK